MALRDTLIDLLDIWPGSSDEAIVAAVYALREQRDLDDEIDGEDDDADDRD